MQEPNTASPAELLTVDELLDMELGRKQQRLLRGFINSPRGLTRLQVLQTMYADHPEADDKVRGSMGSGAKYVIDLIRDLRTELRLVGIELADVEWRGRGGNRYPVRWALRRGGEDEEPGPDVKLPHVVHPEAVRGALGRCGPMARIVIHLLSSAGEAGMSGQEFMSRMYPDPAVRPLEPINAIQQHVGAARVALRLYGMTIISRPRAGMTARRYLVRTR